MPKFQYCECSYLSSNKALINSLFNKMLPSNIQNGSEAYLLFKSRQISIPTFCRSIAFDLSSEPLLLSGKQLVTPDDGTVYKLKDELVSIDRNFTFLRSKYGQLAGCDGMLA
jgi:hypothetical protein